MPQWMTIALAVLGGAGTLTGMIVAWTKAVKAQAETRRIEQERREALAYDHGQREAERKQMDADIDGIGRKVEHVRKDLQSQIDEQRREHSELSERVARIDATTQATHDSVVKLVSLHMRERDDGR